MKKDIHPKLYEINTRCACGNSFQTISTQSSVDVDICSNCHPFFTGQQKFIDTAGRIEKFQARYSAAGAKKKQK
jgi:large subunit ribosomal protein L31